jgi:hypothetical protein
LPWITQDRPAESYAVARPAARLRWRHLGRRRPGGETGCCPGRPGRLLASVPPWVDGASRHVGRTGRGWPPSWVISSAVWRAWQIGRWLPAARLAATGVPRLKIGAALSPLLTAGRSPAGPYASVVNGVGRNCLDGRWPAVLAVTAGDGIGRHLRRPAAPRTFRTPAILFGSIIAHRLGNAKQGAARGRRERQRVPQGGRSSD